MRTFLLSAVPCLALTGVFLCVWGVALCEGAQGRTWHVSQQRLPGIGEGLQLRTISEAAQRVEPGDTVVVHGGVYREAVVEEKSGTSERPIGFLAAAGEHVVVTGADRITEWERADPDRRIFSTVWPYRFITRNDRYAHPNDDYHLLIGRAEQVFWNGYALHQVLARDQMSRGSFWVDLEAGRLYIWGYGNEEMDEVGVVEASTCDVIWESKGDYVQVRGLRFRYAANRAQQGAVRFSGNHGLVEDCVFEKANGSGAAFSGQDIVVRRCTFEDNGQLGFGASRAHRLLLTGCTVRSNNTKGFSRDWEAGETRSPSPEEWCWSAACSSRTGATASGSTLAMRTAWSGTA